MMNPRSWLKQRVLRHVAERNDRLRRSLGQTRGLPPEAWQAAVSSRGHLEIGGCDVVELARRFGTPLYVVDERKLRRDYLGFINGFRQFLPKVEVGYSYKTNPLPEVIRVLHDCGALAEVISHFELWLALRLGVAPTNIIVNGPAKSAACIELAVERRVKLINIDGMDEIDAVAAAAARHGVRQPVGVRVVTSVGWQAQFGMRLRSGEAWRAFERILQLPQLIPTGLHVHLGTGIKDVHTYLQAIREMLEFARQLAAEKSVRLEYFDFGGGFGVATVQPYGLWDGRLMMNNLPPGPVDTSDAPSIPEYARRISELLREFYAPADLPTIAFEPGRAISSSAQSLALGVLTVKRESDGMTRAILDGGKNCTLPTGYEYHELLPSSRMLEPLVAPVTFYGPLCHPGDVIFVQKQFPRLATGDIVSVMDAGAYFVPNQMNFSNPRPAAARVEDGNAVLIRRREAFDDIVRLDPGPRSGEATVTLAESDPACATSRYE
jgi:diaminopimelate decarboxylase